MDRNCICIFQWFFRKNKKKIVLNLDLDQSDLKVQGQDSNFPKHINLDLCLSSIKNIGFEFESS